MKFVPVTNETAVSKFRVPVQTPVFPFSQRSQSIANSGAKSPLHERVALLAARGHKGFLDKKCALLNTTLSCDRLSNIRLRQCFR